MNSYVIVIDDNKTFTVKDKYDNFIGRIWIDEAKKEIRINGTLSITPAEDTKPVDTVYL